MIDSGTASVTITFVPFCVENDQLCEEEDKDKCNNEDGGQFIHKYKK